jgi:hypothetical protein
VGLEQVDILKLLAVQSIVNALREQLFGTEASHLGFSQHIEQKSVQQPGMIF